MLALILEAATRVIERESLAGFNTNRVAEVAGISVGSLYQYFPNKAALVTAIIERTQSALLASVSKLALLSANRTLDEVLHAWARLAIEQQYANPILAAALDHEEKRLPIQDTLAQSEQQIAHVVAALLGRYADELGAQLPHCAAQDCLLITKALVESGSQAATRAPPDLESRIVRALSGYLRG